MTIAYDATRSAFRDAESIGRIAETNRETLALIQQEAPGNELVCKYLESGSPVRRYFENGTLDTDWFLVPNGSLAAQGNDKIIGILRNTHVGHWPTLAN